MSELPQGSEGAGGMEEGRFAAAWLVAGGSWGLTGSSCIHSSADDEAGLS